LCWRKRKQTGPRYAPVNNGLAQSLRGIYVIAAASAKPALGVSVVIDPALAADDDPHPGLCYSI
jgi:hypothetical protein